MLVSLVFGYITTTCREQEDADTGEVIGKEKPTPTIPTKVSYLLSGDTFFWLIPSSSYHGRIKALVISRPFSSLDTFIAGFFVFVFDGNLLSSGHTLEHEYTASLLSTRQTQMMSLNGKLFHLESRLLALNSPIKHGPRIAYAVEACLGLTDLTAAVFSADNTLPRL